MTQAKNTGLKRIVKAAGYSVNGIRSALSEEAAFRQEALLALVFIPLAFFVADNNVERALLIGVTLLVLIVELLNSAIEAVVDRVGTEHHILSGKAKDMGSAAVLVALVLWAFVWFDILVN